MSTLVKVRLAETHYHVLFQNYLTHVISQGPMAWTFHPSHSMLTTLFLHYQNSHKFFFPDVIGSTALL